jgi:RNA polymerase sigma-70 factor (ECF subfamily)
MRWKRSHEPEFEALLRPHLESLYRVAYRFTGHRADAEDLIQDLLVKLFPRMEELCALDNPRPWLIRVLYNQFIDTKRHHARTPSGHLEVLQAFGDGDPLDELQGDAPDPAQVVDRVLTQQALLKALDSLEEEHRALLSMHEMEGYSLKELQSVFEVPLGTLKSRLFRARQALKQALGWEPDEQVERVYPGEVKKWTVVK